VQYIGALSVDSSPLFGWEIFREILDATYVLHNVDLWVHEFSDDGGAFQQHDALLGDFGCFSQKDRCRKMRNCAISDCILFYYASPKLSGHIETRLSMIWYPPRVYVTRDLEIEM
jgi:hypothetical protein